jgi:hypothetical protein
MGGADACILVPKLLQGLCQVWMYVLAISLHHDVFLSSPCCCRKKANTSPRLWGKVLACHAADLLLGQELAVRPAYQT